MCAHLSTTRCNSKVQYKAAPAAEKRHYIVGVPAIVLGALVSTSIFASLDSSPDAAEKIAAGAIGLLASALAATHTFVNYPRGQRPTAPLVRNMAMCVGGVSLSFTDII